MRIALGRYRLTVRLHARCPWTHFKTYKYREGSMYFGPVYARHLVWGRLSILLEDIDLELFGTCKLCGSYDIAEQSGGMDSDESWTVCDNCGAIEQGYTYLSIRQLEAQS